MVWSTLKKQGSSNTDGETHEERTSNGAAAAADGGSSGISAAATSPLAAVAAVGAMTTAVAEKARAAVKEVQDAVIETIEETNDFDSEESYDEDDDEEETALGRRRSISNTSYRNGPHSKNTKVKFHVQSYLVDHYSLMVPSSTVRFRPGSSPSTGGRRTSVMTNATAAAVMATSSMNDKNNMGTIDEEKVEEQGVPSPSVPPEDGGDDATFHTASRVIEDSSNQIILEERYDKVTKERRVIVKRVTTG